jgi:hypothetical protein
MNEAIEEIGVENVAQVLTNNDASWKRACQIIKAKNSHVVYSGCIPHVLDLILEDIRKWDWVIARWKVTSYILQIIVKVKFCLEKFQKS